MSYRDFLIELDEAQLDAYAKRAGTTTAYIRCHLIAARRIPKPKLMRALWRSTDGKCAWGDVIEHFYGSPEKDDDAA